MNSRLRYGLIGFGCALFAILAPLTVLYVRGLRYDWDEQRLRSTGILAIRTSPENVEVWLGGTKVLEHDGDVKFLDPGEYDVTVSSPGYFPWRKRLAIHANQVTWVNPVPYRLPLFLSSGPAETVAEGAVGFAVADGQVVTVSGRSVTFTPRGGTESRTEALPGTAERFEVSVDANLGFVFGTTAAGTPFFSAIDLAAPSPVTAIGSFGGSVSCGGRKACYGLDSGTLFKVDPADRERQAVASSVVAFTVLKDSLYYLQGATSTAALKVRTGPSEEEQVIIGGIPLPERAEVLVNQQKRVFLLLDGTLYRVGTKLEPISGSVAAASLSKGGQQLSFTHDGEASLYDVQGQRSQLITRSQQPIRGTEFLEDLGTGFLIVGQEIKAIELDPRDRQNEYVLYRGQDPKAFALDREYKHLYVLDGGTVKKLTIRR